MLMAIVLFTSLGWIKLSSLSSSSYLIVSWLYNAYQNEFSLSAKCDTIQENREALLILLVYVIK